MNTSLTHQPAYRLPTPMVPPPAGLTETIRRERGRLGGFIRRRVPDPGDAEDILQDVFFELVEAYRLPEPIEQVGAWLFRVARNRIVDRFRKKREMPLPHAAQGQDDGGDGDDGGGHWLERVLPAAGSSPDVAYERRQMLEAIAAALDELPASQREVFIAHELDGRSFKDLAAHSGVKVNTLLGMKRLAVLHLRRRLQPLHDETSW
jgi:RNA polymerase sigma factor (sigma-70 family)